MASPNDDRDIDEEKELEKKLRALLDRKKAVFERSKETDKELLQIRQDEMAIQERLQQIRADRREVEQLRQILERLRVENTQLKELQSRRSSASDSKIESLEAELNSMKEKVAVCEREHGGADDVNEMKEELDTLRRQSVEQSASLSKVKDAMQRTTSYSKTQRKEKEKLRREVASLKDEIAALRLISEETQQRQLNEIQSSSTAKKRQQKQQSAGKVYEQMLAIMIWMTKIITVRIIVVVVVVVIAAAAAAAAAIPVTGFHVHKRCG